MHKYRSLIAWQRARQLSLLILRATESSQKPARYALFDQLRRAAISIEANIVEGYALATKPQFRRHLRIAIGSGAEVECLNELVAALQWLPADVTTQAQALLDEILACLHGLIRRLGGSRP